MSGYPDNITDTTAPPSGLAPFDPVQGELWYDESIPALKIFYKGSWVTVTAPSTGGGSTITLGDITTAINAEITRADTKYETKTDASASNSAEVTRADAKYQTKTDAATAVTTEITRADTKYETKVDATAAMTAEVTRADTKYETKTDSATAIANEVTRANAAYVPKTDQIATSAGATSVGKSPILNNAGHLDGSFLNLPGSLIIRGTTDPAQPAPAAVLGDFYIASVDGTADASFTGLGGTAITKGSVLIKTQTDWADLAPATDLTAFYTKQDTDTKIGTLATNAALGALTARVAALEAILAGVTVTAAVGPTPTNITFPGTVTAVTGFKGAIAKIIR